MRKTVKPTDQTGSVGFYCMATLSSQVKSHEYRDSRREEENAGLRMMKEEQRKKVQNKERYTDGLNNTNITSTFVSQEHRS